MLEPSVKNDLIELLSKNFTTKDLNEIGSLLFKNFDTHGLSGVKNHITISPRKGSEILVNHCEEKKKTKNLIKLIVEMDDRVHKGKHLQLEGLEFFLSHLAKQGFVYDERTRSLIDCTKDKDELKNWGSLRDGKVYDITVGSIDIVGNSKLVKKYGMRKMETFYYQLWRFLKDKLKKHNGRLWSWAGDGGICAFTFKDHVCRAVLFALEVQSSIPLFNLRQDKPVPENIELRIALDTGKLKFYSETGKIVSDTVNYAAHLEKKGTDPGTVTISNRVYKDLTCDIASVFVPRETFEDRECRITYRRLDDLFIDLPHQTAASKKSRQKKRA